MQIQTVLDQIDLGAMALTEFQRGYVRNREHVRGQVCSLYRKGIFDTTETLLPQDQ